MRSPAVPILVILAVMVPAWSATAQPGRRAEFRALNNEYYHVGIQKRGQVDVFLGTGNPFMRNAFPMVWLADEAAPDPLKISGRATERYRVDDRLGLGHGMLFRYKDCEWTLRSYPTQPFLTIQVAYVNTTKRPVRIKALMPWCVGDPKRGVVTLGPGAQQAPILANGLSLRPQLVHDNADSDDLIAVFNPATRISLIAGFLTQDRARTHLELAEPNDDEDEPGFDRFRAVCTYDPPITVAPGESLLSEVFYIAFGEPDPLTGLERYARAVGLANGKLRSEDAPPVHRWVVDPAQFDAADFQKRLTTLAENAEALGIHRVLVKAPPDAEDAGTDVSNTVGTLESRGFDVAVWTNGLPPGDFTPSTIREFARQVTSKSSENFITFDMDAMPLSPPAAGTTGIQYKRELITALRDEVGAGAELYATSSSLLSALLSDGMLAQATWLPAEWKGAPIRQGAFVVDTEQRFHIISQLVPNALLVDAGSYPQPILRRQLTAASLLGAEFLLQGFDVPTQPEALAALRHALPVAMRPARPVDLFMQERPHVLHLPVANPAGESHVVAVFNWSAVRDEVTTLPFAGLGLAPGVFYTVYDFWADRYLGTASDRIDVAVPPNGVTVLILRPHSSAPMLLETGNNLAQTVPEIRDVSWDARSAVLRISIQREPHARETLPIRIPENYAFREVVAETGAAEARVADRVVRVTLTLDEQGRGTVAAHFNRGDQ